MMMGYSNRLVEADSFGSNRTFLVFHFFQAINFIAQSQSTNVYGSKSSPTKIPVPVEWPEQCGETGSLSGEEWLGSRDFGEFWTENEIERRQGSRVAKNDAGALIGGTAT
jgi:hypothetical protein